MNKRRVRKAVKRLENLPGGKYFFLYVINKIKAVCYKIVKSTSVAYPSNIMMELTNCCNLNCITCPREYAYGKEMDKGNMGLDEAKRIVDEVWPYLDSIGLTGLGETFLYKDIVVLTDYIKEKNKGIVISASTNAVLPDFIERVTGLLGKIDTLQVSIDGLNEVYELIRKKSSFSLLDKNLRILAYMAKNTGTDIMMNMVVTRENYKHMPLLVKYAKEINVKYLDFTLFNLASVTDIDRSYYDFYQSAEFEKSLSELETAIAATPEVIVTERNFKTSASFHKCPFPWSHFYITWDGYVVPCCGKPFPKLLHFGNVFESGVLKVLNSDKYRKFRMMWFRNATPEFCDKCHFIDIRES